MSINNELFNMRIFTVDDEDYNTLLIEELLLEVGFDNIRRFHNGSDLISSMDEGDIPDLILSDIMMPNLNGYEMCEIIKKNKRYVHIPIIMITAASMENSEPLSKSFDAGAMDFISKPINEIELTARVKSALIMEKQRKELVAALNEVQALRGLFPICSYCKKIRDDKDYWTEIETYISTHSDAKFSHSICPDCYEKFVRPELDELKKNKK